MDNDFIHGLLGEQEELRKTERKNRDEFRKLMEEHVAAGTLTAKTQWSAYCMKVNRPFPFVLLNVSSFADCGEIIIQFLFATVNLAVIILFSLVINFLFFLFSYAFVFSF